MTPHFSGADQVSKPPFNERSGKAFPEHVKSYGLVKVNLFTFNFLCRIGVSVRLLWTQGQFAQVMFVEFAMGVRGLVQPERARDMDFERTGLDQAVERFNLFGAWLHVVDLDLHTGRRFWFRPHSVGISDAS